MTVLDVLTIIIVLALVAAGAVFIVVHLRRGSCDGGSEAFREEVAKLRAEVREIRNPIAHPPPPATPRPRGRTARRWVARCWCLLVDRVPVDIDAVDGAPEMTRRRGWWPR